MCVFFLLFVITHCPQGATVLEGLAASGLRSIRYALELDGVARVHANDLDPAVVESMRRNISMNGPVAEAKVQPHCSDARLLMLQNPLVSEETEFCRSLVVSWMCRLHVA